MRDARAEAPPNSDGAANVKDVDSSSNSPLRILFFFFIGEADYRDPANYRCRHFRARLFSVALALMV
jgi:hypothetical protein